MNVRFLLFLMLCGTMTPLGARCQDLGSERVAAAFAMSAKTVLPAVVEQMGTCKTEDRAQIARLVRSVAHDEGFDADLAEAIAWAESDLGATQGPSKAGALGIMQLMPGTASDLGVTDRCDAAMNVRAGIRYLKSLYHEFQDPLLMLGAYNAGLNKVYEAQGIPVNPETAEYVIKILNRWKFGRVLKRPEPGRSEIFATALPASADAWQDGHVIDFGN